MGVGVIYGPAGCPACFWTENDVSNNPLADMKDDADFNHQEAELQLARASFKLAEEENERLRARVAELLEANNRYLEDARAARRELRDAKAINALITRQLITLREALEFYADEAHYDEEGVVGTVTTSHDPTSVGSGPESETDPDLGTVAEQALQDVFGYQRPVDPPDPYKHNPGARPMPHPGAK